ncbi:MULTISPECIES: MarR family winged helix-turn-helix transcriptional regulator [unclassified Flavonifractor]|nr:MULTISPECIES: MarR family transcriptional regulator [unclassified Flavonifractor]HIZ93722.1 MarR family transcriptional regulator [Candidatus Flavonifractor avicola]OUN09604.1 MarR family transcriptional regulator [Flavonifractor sp. An91]OUN09647.1 MarR family transcriptional regulator [Flavonifractor sp. An9]OUN85575.1 MarR family transcriptional regulator [Flavonifractor sp. An52]OUO13465.1 MarR family transcriptional regulator [Flavonifractor sp. An4]
MDRSFHYLLMATQSLFQRSVMAELNGSGLTAGQPKVLDYLGRHDGSVQKAIAAGCQIDPATLTGLLNRMEEKGLIRRCNEDGNRRSLHVYLTEQGWAKQREVRQTMERQSEVVQAGLSEEQRAQLLDCLYKVCANMTDMEGLQ